MPGWMLQTHTYSHPGTYTIVTTATDSYGQTQSDSMQVTVIWPSINIPIFAGATSVSGLAKQSAVVSLSVNGIAQSPVVADGTTGAWTVTVQNALVMGDNISATATILQQTGSPVTATVLAPLNSTANLSNLVIGPTLLGTLSPAFSPTIYSYTEV